MIVSSKSKVGVFVELIEIGCNHVDLANAWSKTDMCVHLQRRIKKKKNQIE